MAGTTLGLLILFWISRRINPGAVLSSIAGASPALLLLALGAALLALWLKGERWAMAISAGAGSPPRRRLFSSMLIGMAGNIALPARVGDFLRAFVLRRHNGVAVTRALTASWGVQVFDFLAVALILFVLSPGSGFAPRAALAAIVGAAVGILLVLAAVRRYPRLFRVIKLIPERAQRRVEPVIESAHSGLAFLASGRVLAGGAGMTIGVWLAEGIGITIGLRAFGLHPPLAVGPLLAAAIGLSFVLPLTPGSLGTFQLVTIFVLGAFGIERESAFAFGLGFQAVTQVGVLSCGFAALQREGLDWRSLPGRTSDAGGE